jgi:hypothetical protein
MDLYDTVRLRPVSYGCEAWFFTLRGFQNEFGPKGRGWWRQLFNEQIHNLCYPSRNRSTMGVINFRSVRWVAQIYVWATCETRTQIWLENVRGKILRENLALLGGQH